MPYNYGEQKVFMYYREFLKILAELTSHCKGSVIIEDHLIFVEVLSKNMWRISCRIFGLNAGIPKEVYDCLSSRYGLKWEDKGPYLKLDNDSSSVILIYDVPSNSKYLSFREALRNFLPLAKDWNRFFQELI